MNPLSVGGSVENNSKTTLFYCWEMYIEFEIKTIPSPGFVHKIFWRDP